MKVYSCPPEVPEPVYDYNANPPTWEAVEAEHSAKLVEWLKSQGYKGPTTGKIVRFGVADGHAQYMYADNGAKSILIHLPYGDAWNYQDIKFLPRAEILRRIKQQDAVDKLFKHHKKP